VEILSGVFEDRTTGAPIALFIKNRDARAKSYDYMKNLFRPGHGDYTYHMKYGHYDYRAQEGIQLGRPLQGLRQV
jgi:chorismate synthase